MKVAAIYDIHGNLPALEAVFREIRRANVDHVVVGGDVVPGPMPAESLQRLVELETSVQFIRGNGEREVLAQMAGEETEWFRTAPEPWRVPVRWTAGQLNVAQRNRLSGWPTTCRLGIPGFGEVLFCHATPRSDSEIFTRLTPEERLLPIFGQVEADVVVCGHTHMQFDRTVGGTRILNAGSVGMPFGKPGAYWLLLGPAIAFRHTAYDLEEAAERIRQTRYPQAQEFAARNVLQAPTEEQALGSFARVELR